MNLEILLAVIGSLVGVSGLAYAIIRDKTNDTVSIASRVAQLETKVDLMWARLQKDMAKILAKGDDDA